MKTYFRAGLGLCLALYGPVLRASSVDQLAGLQSYAGHWVSSESVDSEVVGHQPGIKMFNHAVMAGQSLQVEVQQWQGDGYRTILTELISYDARTDQIHAFGQNVEGVNFKGEGGFTTASTWVMNDVDMQGDHYLTVNFDFQDRTNVRLEGFAEDGSTLWATRYIKSNPRDKNIGVQLVSVHEEMLEAPHDTLRQLGRMGFSYVETFVYRDRQFYDMAPAEFRRLVEEAGLRFLGSMVVMDAPPPYDWADSADWWNDCIADHVEAGVEYLTVSNHVLKEVTTLAELQGFCDYYNALGRQCAARGIRLAIHNHADEFREVQGTRIYDYLLANTDPDYVFFQADIYWMTVGGVSAHEYAETYGERFLSWHVKDYKELGASGEIDWKRLFGNPAVSLPQYVIAEVEDYSYPPMHSIQLAWQYLYYELLAEN